MSKRLLLADDSITIQKVIQITFAHEDYELTITDNGDSGYARARELQPDLVLADVYMPGKNGYELCAAIKQDPQLRHVPVLLLAGSFEPFDEGKARAAGADAWIEKPFESQALIDKVASLLNAASQAPAAATVAAPPLAPPQVEPVAPASIDPFADISFEEPVAAAVPPAAAAATPDDWSDLAAPPVEPVTGTPSTEFASEEPDAALPSFEFAAEPLSPASAEPFAFEAPPLEAGLDVFGEAEEVVALGEEDILGAEDLEPVGEMPTLTPWSREAAPGEESFEAFAAPEPEPPVFAAPIEPPPAEPAPSLAHAVLPAAPSAEAAMAAGAPAGQRVAMLTEAEIERIVERAVGKAVEKLSGTVLERVAWEVVPDLAEALIREEIRKIKETAD